MGVLMDFHPGSSLECITATAAIREQSHTLRILDYS
jgi:hypothetical protein